MRHQTDDPAERAASITDNAAGKVWEETGDYDKWYICWQEIYRNALIELCPQNV